MAQNNTRQCFNFDITHARALDLREVANLLLGELNIFQVAIGQLIQTGLLFFMGKHVGFSIPSIKFDR